MKLKDWTADYQNFVRLDGKMDTEVDQNIYTELEYLNSAKISMSYVIQMKSKTKCFW